MTSDGLPNTLVLHVGAHKTASTHLQHTLIAAKPIPNTAFWSPRLLRGPGESVPERFGFPLDPKTAIVSQKSPQDMLVEMADSADRLVISEETFVGRLQRGWGRIPTPLYFTATARIAKFAQIVTEAGGPAIDLCLGIRNPTDYLASAYSQILNGNRVILPEKYRERNDISDVNWADYVQRLRGVPGVGRLTVWRHEDYADLFPQICMAMVGTGDIPVLAGRVQQRLSSKAVDTILLAKSWSGPEMIHKAANALPLSPDNPPYDLYDEETHAQSQAFYNMQCDAIAAMQNVTFLQK